MKTFMLLFFAALFILPIVIFAQDPIVEPEVDPEGWVKLLFSPAIAVMVTSIVGITKLARNAINLKGKLAYMLTFVVSVGYGLIQYTGSHGFATALLVGVLSALTATTGFWLTKLFGKEVNPAGTK